MSVSGPYARPMRESGRRLDAMREIVEAMMVLTVDARMSKLVARTL
jgi:hypothetical protein